jgi:hypothetical protein
MTALLPGNAKYRGDVRETVIGAVMGPLNYQAFAVAVEADYDPVKHRTTVRFRVAELSDLTQSAHGQG